MKSCLFCISETQLRTSDSKMGECSVLVRIWFS